jgi:hypothetical protein
MDASSSVPLSTISIADSENLVWICFVEACSKVLNCSKLIVSGSNMIFDSLFYYSSLWESLIISLRHDSFLSTMKKLLFCITKSMLSLVKLPFVVSLLLLSWSEVSMSLHILFLHVSFLFHLSVLWIQNFFSINGSNCWFSKIVNLLALHLAWPVVFPLIPLSKWLSDRTLVLGLLNVVELVGKAVQVLRLDHSVDMITAVSVLSENVVWSPIFGVVSQSGVDLVHTWLVLS